MLRIGCLQSAINFFLHLLISALAFGFLYFSFTAIYPLSSANPLSKYFPYVAATIGGAATFLTLRTLTLDKNRDVVRGERLIPAWLAKLMSMWKTRRDSYPFYWGGLWLPFSSGVMGMAAIGAPGSGKTVTIRLFLQSIINRVGIVPEHRALIYDAKGDMYQFLSGIGVDISLERGLVNNLNPYDARSCSWELCNDIQDIKTLDEISLIFVPVNPKEEYWADQARNLLQDVLKSFVLGGRYWTLRDLCAATRTIERLKYVLKQHPETRTSIQSFLELGQTTDGIVSTLQSRMKRYEVIAALWEHAESKISLTEWLYSENGRIILLGRGERGSALDAINQLMVSRLGQLIADPAYPNSEVRRTWIIFDEIRQCGRLDLDSIATIGRSKGASLVIGFQDKSGLNETYNKDIADEILGICQHKAVFSLSSDTTARWSANEFGKQEVIENEQRRETFAVLPSEFTSTRHIPETNWWNGLTGFYKIHGIGAYKKTLKGWRLFGIPSLGYKGKLYDLDTNVHGFIQCDINQQIMVDWTPFDLDRLGYQWGTVDLVKLNIEQEEGTAEDLAVPSDEWIDPLAGIRKEQSDTEIVADKQNGLGDDNYMGKKLYPINTEQSTASANVLSPEMTAYEAERSRLFETAMEDAFRKNDEALRRLAE